MVGVKIGRMEKEEWKTGKKIMFSLIWFRKENTKDGKYWGKKIHRAHKYLSPDLGGKVGRKERKVGLALELHIYPFDVLYVSFFSFLFYFIMGNCVIVTCESGP